MPSERPLIVSEGNWLDDADRMLMSKQVDFREPRDRYSVSTLVKLGESQLAPGRLRTIRISKPEFFRRGRDPNETRAQQSTEHVDDIDEPEGLAQLRAAEVNRAAELVDSRIRVTADGMRVRRTRRRKTTNTISLRNHGWIYCTAIEPTSDEEWRDLKAMMPSEYDHASYIYRPRAFALALGSMLADQFGIRGGEVQVDARIADLHASSRRGSQTIFHGPVVYEQDRFARFTSPRNEFEAFLGKIFIKDKCLEAEREYRFAIWSEDEPAEDHVDLRISLAMQEAMLPLITPSRETYQETDPPDSSAPDVPQVPRDLPPAAKLSELTSHEPALPDPLELLSDPSVGVRPHMLGTEPPAGAEDMTACVIRSLRERVYRQPEERRAQAASAAYYAEPLLIRLCELFVDPIHKVSITTDAFVVISINVTVPSSGITFAIGPSGNGVETHQVPELNGVRGVKGSLTFSANKTGLPLSSPAIERMAASGLTRRVMAQAD